MEHEQATGSLVTYGQGSPKAQPYDANVDTSYMYDLEGEKGEKDQTKTPRNLSLAD